LNILAFDCSLGSSSIYLLANQQEYEIYDTAFSSKSLLINIDKLLKINNLHIEDIDTIIVGKGPGSFTGIRIALSTAKTLKFLYGNHIKFLSFSSIELLASYIISTYSLTEKEFVLPAIYGFQKKYFFSVIRKNKQTIEMVENFLDKPTSYIANLISEKKYLPLYIVSNKLSPIKESLNEIKAEKEKIKCIEIYSLPIKHIKEFYEKSLCSEELSALYIRKIPS
jgi:tRNA threonylcarbamoyl adenosine modification protein YeaZ